VVATIMAVAALSVASSVFAPVAFALFIIALVWPMQKRLQDFLPRLLALAVSEIVLHAKGIHRDGLFAAIKPIYELPAGLVGALVAAWFSRMGQQDA